MLLRHIHLYAHASSREALAKLSGSEPPTRRTEIQCGNELALSKLVYQINGKVKKINATERTTLQPFNAAASPPLPSAAAMMIPGILAIDLVARRR